MKNKTRKQPLEETIINIPLLTKKIKSKTIERKQPLETTIINIPTIDNNGSFERNREKADSDGHNHCPVCGRTIKNPKFFINSIWGGSAYRADDKGSYNDTWVMGVGTECRKKFPNGYVFENIDFSLKTSK